MKGSGGEVLFALIMILFSLFYLYAFSYTAASGALKTEKIIFEEGEVISTTNTFYAVNTSLGITWKISAAQSIFRAGDESIGCGLDNNQIGEKYWFQTDRDVRKNSFRDNILPPQGSKYNNPSYNPKLCLPDFFSATNLGVNEYLRKKFLPYQEIPKNFTVNRIKFNISELVNDFSIPEEMDKVYCINSQKIQAETDDTRISSLNVTQNNTIYTEFPKMVKAAQATTGRALLLSNFMQKFDSSGTNPTFNPEMTYLSNYHYNPTQNKYEYENKITSFVEDYAKQYVDANLEKTSVDIKTTVELRGNIVNVNYSDVFAYEQGLQYTYQGLIIHYDTEIKLLEGTSGMKPLTNPDILSSGMRKAIEDAVRKYQWTFVKSDSITFTDISYSNEEIVALVASIIQQDGGLSSTINPDYPLPPNSGSDELRKEIEEASTMAGIPAPFLATTSYMEASGYWKKSVMNDECVRKYSSRQGGQQMEITTDQNQAFSSCGYSYSNYIGATGPMQLDQYRSIGDYHGNYDPTRISMFRELYGFEYPVHGESYYDTSIYYAALTFKYGVENVKVWNSQELGFDTPEKRLALSSWYGTTRYSRQAEFEANYFMFSQNAQQAGSIEDRVRKIYDLFSALNDEAPDKEELMKYVIAGYREGADFFSGNSTFPGIFALCGNGLKWEQYDDCLRQQGLYIETLNYVKKVMMYYPQYTGGANLGIASWPVKSTAGNDVKTISQCYMNLLYKDPPYSCGMDSNGNSDPTGINRHSGLDIAASTGTPVAAALPGKVIIADSSGQCAFTEGGPAYGRCIFIEHTALNGDKYYTLYAHLQTVDVNVNDMVTAGQQIGKADASAGLSGGGIRTFDGPHLHFELRKAPGRYCTDSLNPCLLFPEKCRQYSSGASDSENRCQETQRIGLGSLIVAVDPGHGGSNTGASGSSGINEKFINLEIAKKLTSKLQQEGIIVYMTRNSDIDVPNHERMANAKNAGANIFVSIHANDAGSSCPGGTETVYSDNAYKSDSKELAFFIQDNVVQSVQRDNRGIYPSSDTSRSPGARYIIGYDYMPAALIETLFMCNPDEEAILNSPTGQQRIADGIYEGIMKYMQSRSINPEPDYEDFKDLYYYHDEANNRFVPRPIELDFKLEDYLVALNCRQDPWDGNNYLPIGYSTYNWYFQNDMLCCGGLLYSCSSEIPGVLGTQAGDLFNGTKTSNRNACESTLALETSPCKQIECTENGFQCIDPPNFSI